MVAGLQVGVVVGHRRVPVGGAVERVGGGRCVREPGQVLARPLEVYVCSLQGEGSNGVLLTAEKRLCAVSLSVRTVFGVYLWRCRDR